MPIPFKNISYYDALSFLILSMSYLVYSTMLVTSYRHLLHRTSVELVCQDGSWYDSSLGANSPVQDCKGQIVTKIECTRKYQQII